MVNILIIGLGKGYDDSIHRDLLEILKDKGYNIYYINKKEGLRDILNGNHVSDGETHYDLIIYNTSIIHPILIGSKEAEMNRAIEELERGHKKFGAEVIVLADSGMADEIRGLVKERGFAQIDMSSDLDKIVEKVEFEIDSHFYARYH